MTYLFLLHIERLAGTLALSKQLKESEFLGEPMIKHIANIITTCRILGSVLLLFSPAFSMAFYIIYSICGFSDMIDGSIARKTKSTSKFGNKLDSIADLAFVIVSFIKILPAISLPKWLWIWSIAIAIVKIGNIILGYLYKKHFISLHTIMNKITGFLLFLLPLTSSFIDVKYTSIVVCIIATFAAIQEAVYIASFKGSREA